jgi:hypothetical protein
VSSVANERERERERDDDEKEEVTNFSIRVGLDEEKEEVIWANIKLIGD